MSDGDRVVDGPQPGSVLQRISDGVVFLDEEFRCTYANERAERLLDRDAEELVGHELRELFPGSAGGASGAAFEEAVETDRQMSYERRDDDSGRWFEVQVYPDPDGLSVFFRDVTDRKQRVRRLERAETMFQNTQDALFLVDVEDGGERFRLERVNPTYERLTGLTNERLGGETIREAFDEEDAAAIQSQYSECVERREPIEYEERLSVPEPGSYWETRIAPVVIDGEVVQLVGATRDVTDRKEREQQLRETRNTLEAIVEHSPDAVVMVDEDHRVTRWNRAAEEMFGWTEDEVLGERAPFVPEERVAEFETFVDELDAGEVKRGVRTVRRTRDGERIDVSLSSTKVTVDDDLVGYMATFEDVGQRLAYERRLERQRDDLELLTQTMSHDVRNDLEAVVGYAELLKADLDGERRRYAEEILESARTAVDFVRSASDLAGAMLKTDREREPIPLGSTLTSQVEQVRSTHPTATVTVDGEIPGVTVLADDMLSSVFGNLLKNAVQHNDEAVPRASVSVDVAPESVVVHVADNGPGIPEEVRDDLFGRGEKGLDSGGTGIGLYLVDTLLDQYGGEVRVADNDPTGTVFSVELERA